jgi:hypothetical protein
MELQLRHFVKKKLAKPELGEKGIRPLPCTSDCNAATRIEADGHGLDTLQQDSSLLKKLQSLLKSSRHDEERYLGPNRYCNPPPSMGCF